MSEFTQNKTAGVFATFLIGFIILAFMFTGYQQFGNDAGGVSNVGSVAGMPIKREEYLREYNRQIEVYKQIFGGELNSKQLETYNIKDSAIKNIVQRKLMVKFAKDIGVFPAEEEIKAEIKTLPYFLTNGQFDITRYKAILAANQLTPVEFEGDVIDQIRMKKLQELTNTFPLSKGYLNDLERFRSEKLSAEIVQITKSALSQFVPVTPLELSQFLAVETNKKRIESIFKERQPSLDRPEEASARHILLLTEGKNENDVKMQIEKIVKEVTPANFASLADKYTEDPSGKGKGGDLGSFSRGRMVPEFDQVAFTQKVRTISAPIKTTYGYHLILVEKRTPAITAKLEDYRDKFSTEIIQKDKVADIKNLTISTANNLRKEFEAGNAAAVKSIVEKYKLQYNKGTINRLDGASTGLHLTSENMKAIFAQDLKKPQFHSFDDGANLIMIRTTPGEVAGTEVKTETAPAANATSLKNALAKKMMDNFLKQMEANSKVKVNNDVLQM